MNTEENDFIDKDAAPEGYIAVKYSGSCKDCDYHYHCTNGEGSGCMVNHREDKQSVMFKRIPVVAVKGDLDCYEKAFGLGDSHFQKGTVADLKEKAKHLLTQEEYAILKMLIKKVKKESKNNPRFN